MGDDLATAAAAITAIALLTWHLTRSAIERHTTPRPWHDDPTQFEIIEPRMPGVATTGQIRRKIQPAPTPRPDTSQWVPIRPASTPTVVIDGPPPPPPPDLTPGAPNMEILTALAPGPRTSKALAEATGTPWPETVARLQALILDHAMVTVLDNGAAAAVYDLPNRQETRMGSLLIITTTETDTIEAAARSYTYPGKHQPHLLVDPSAGIALPLIGGEQASDRDSALLHPAWDGGMQVHWLDVVGYANRLPEPSAQWWDTLAMEVRTYCDENDIRVHFPKAFEPYVGAGGPHEQRMTAAELREAAGIIGAQHIPGGHLGEPGDMSRLAEILTGEPVPTDVEPLTGIQRRLRAAGFYGGPVGGQSNTVSIALESAVADALARVEELEVIAHGQRSEIADLVDRMAADEGRMANARDGLELLLDSLLGPEMGPRAAADLADVLDPAQGLADPAYGADADWVTYTADGIPVTDSAELMIPAGEVAGPSYVDLTDDQVDAVGRMLDDIGVPPPTVDDPSPTGATVAYDEHEGPPSES